MSIKHIIVFIFTLTLLIACDPITANKDEIATNSQCQPNQACTYPKKAKIWLSEHLISPETPFKINVSLSDGNIIHSAKLEGVTMYMGYIPLQFKLQDNVLTANAMVGICSERNMTWKLILELKNQKNQIESVYYYFTVIY
ncbi:hypothetical protein AMS58_02865 [Pseudoalteromonas porphyrae]|uniref:Lipoprotein n=1 Tax=Pseudoalteromonas porphyrae TaxID=187330 RepID=A0A0N1EVV7_9GAMM|nr:MULTISPECIES: hypothetical protein [Pseudoalteromonas]KPH64205.1 hypothetical protein ADS77_05825 [Pseudoalteromonas porphyrae]KPH96038.1 hypothetical protein AMS58_02865 [Pseudoalteromonas porphyrae]NMR27823.1 hypothetical protein [Pseudoalteromonas sp. NEC-BIFX-2020_015]NNG44431.1 hypothetical protein [Pseudoalteromonas sp. NEC-BIFX-2020_002]